MSTYRGDVPTGRQRALLTVVIVGLLFGNVVALRADDPSAGDQAASEPQLIDDAASERPAADGGPSASQPEPSTATDPGTATTHPAVTATTTTTLPPIPADDQLAPPSTLPGGYEFEMTLEPRCVKVGQMIKVTAHLKYRGGIAMRATYADGDAHDSGHAATAWDQSGVVTHEWPAPNAPGDATLFAQAHDPEHNRNGTKTIPFKVVKKSSSC